MTITLSPEAEARLNEKARRDGQDINTVADALILAALDWEARDRAETIEGIRRGDQAAAEGRERPLAEFFAEQRAKYGFPASWPHVSPEQSSLDAS
jgi:predicted transcriptional regulator